MATKAELEQQLADMRARAERAEATHGPQLRVDPADKLDQAPREPGRFKRWINSLDTWETILLFIGVIAVTGIIAYFGGAADESWLQNKAKHYASVVAHGFFGGFLGCVIMWGLNKWKPLQKRVAQAADDSIWAVETWRKRRQADADGEWTVADAVSTLAACIRYGASVLPPILLAAVAMTLAK